MSDYHDVRVDEISHAFQHNLVVESLHCAKWNIRERVPRSIRHESYQSRIAGGSHINISQTPMVGFCDLHVSYQFANRPAENIPEGCLF